MATSNLGEEQQFGKLVALEGDEDTISTQLQLLPKSQKILVLPSFTESLPHNTDKQSFDARAFVRDVYSTFVERTETARSFLKSSTSTQPRLAFVNGGSVCARTTCISAICENITNGEVEEAETIFNGIVEDGVAGLMKRLEVQDEGLQTDLEEDDDKEEEQGEERIEDPTTRAMKAADSLDRETAVLQSDEDKVDEDDDQGHENYPGEYNEIGVAQSVQSVHEVRDQAPLDQDEVSKFENSTDSAGLQRNDDIVRTVVTMRNRKPSSVARQTFGRKYSLSTQATSTPYTAAFTHQIESDDDYDYDEDAVSPGDDTFVSLPPTPAVIYGEACIVDAQAVSPVTKGTGTRRVKSVDRLYQGNSGFPGQASNKSAPLRHTASAFNLGARRESVNALNINTAVDNELPTLPRATFVRASQTMIKRSPTTRTMSVSSQSTQKTAPRVYVDRGTDAEVSEESAEEEMPQPFEPVFAVVEDLVIHFSDNESKQIFDSVIRSYKNGTYPVFPSSPASIPETPVSPKSIAKQGQHEVPLRHASHHTAETDDVGYERRHEFDPYSSEDLYYSSPNQYYTSPKRQWPPRDKLQRMDSGVPTQEPPTPTMTPPPQDNEIAERFVSFSPADSSNAISIQNSLRELLGVHFPTGENGFSQHYYPLTPEAERLWKPVFGNDHNTSAGIESNTVDQMIALGCEPGVKNDYFNQISGHIEKLGAKKDGNNRSAKVDIRYLIGNVMQGFSNLPLAVQSTFNPLSKPELLATLLVPQLETYLASNTSTRLLILQYSSQHLAVVLALRKLLGADLLKIAGILDSLASDPPSILSSPRPPPPVNPLSNDATLLRSSIRHNRGESEKSLEKTKPSGRQVRSKPSVAGSLASARSSSNLPKLDTSGSISFSKADYLIPSTATDAEITTFLSGIWKGLIEKSAFYTPEPEPEPVIIEKIVQAPPVPNIPTPVSPASYRDREYPPSSFRHQGNQSKISRLTGSNKHGYSQSTTGTSKHGYSPSVASTKHGYAASIASTVKTTATERSRRGNKAWENFYIGEEDSDDDAYDKMILGRGFAKIVPEVPKPVNERPKRPTKKALKWLGLA